VVLIGVASRSDGADEEVVFFLGKEHSPLTYPKPKETPILALQPLHVSFSGSGESLDLLGDSLPSWPIEP
jgi:hypothetical protein